MAIDPTTMARKVHVVIPAAGRGVRFGSSENKIYAPLAGRPVIAWTLRAFAGRVDTIVLVAHREETSRLKAIADETVAGKVYVVVGGATRQESVASGMASLSQMSGKDIVLIHDAARPLVSAAVIDLCIEQATLRATAVAALRVADTLKEAGEDRVVGRTVDRSGLWAMQTPQAFQLGLLRRAHEAAKRDGYIGTDDASLVERLDGQPIHLVEGARENIKITEPADLAFAREWLAPQSGLRVGIGYDIHRLVAGRPLWLGGVRIPSEVGLDGHSDADVILHAVCDALLGAAGLPDIGQLFPNTDPAYAGISSLALLKDVAARLSAAGWSVSNADCMVIAERPKIAPHIPAMREAMARVLGTTSETISIKATTNEGLGALGEGLGIACHATAAIVRKEAGAI
ncbi:MAG TPA: 2-C-methyl-D-erythritol 4-phosphate cytidylyltransferase [Capsulimonadaceae bacterium]|nr:2-C-methyl-D-erythritol 4-phosphate cytidylyltransferase [Capsulimonadaceae bacterium]